MWLGVPLLIMSAAASPPAAGDFDVTHYDLTVTPDFDRQSISGETRITFASLADALEEVRFSANALTIDRATVGGQPVRVTRHPDGVVFFLPEPVLRGRTATLSIAFHGAPARGLTFGPRFVYTSYFTCDWMFCDQDRPGDKATIDLTLRLPRGMTSVGVGARRAVKPDANGLEAHTWREETPHSSYVFGFIAGDLQAVSERRGGAELVYLSTTSDAARLRALFASTPQLVQFFEEKAGIPLPHGRYVQLHVPGGLAQEADAFSIVGEAVVSPILADPSDDWAIAHELAHQWWGNLVTCADWNEFWLNEGVATFMTAAWKEHRWGRASYDREIDLARQRAAAAARSVGDVKLTFPGPYPSLAVRRGIQYSKGALFLDRLRREVGDQAFWSGLRSFTRMHAGATVVSRDFQRALEHASGRDLQRLFDQWVY
jgi:aminopeptidase N